MPAAKKIAEISVWNDLNNLRVINDFVTKEMENHNLRHSKIFDVQMAVDEACTNIIQYA